MPIMLARATANHVHGVRAQRPGRDDMKKASAEW
jgi:hypothetical protein